MLKHEYEALQERLRKKLRNSPYLSGRKDQAYEDGVKAAMSILSDFYHHGQNNGWISVLDRLPDPFERVIVCREDGKVEQGYKDVGDRWKVYGTHTKQVAYWMPFPRGRTRSTRNDRTERSDSLFTPQRIG